MYEFKLDFSKSVPYRYCPSAKEAGALYIQCVANAPMDIEFRQVKTGLFHITVSSEEDKHRLENKFVTLDFGENSHTLHSAKIPLIPIEKQPFYQNPKWITIDKLYDSALKYVTNEQVDEYLKRYGDIIVPTHFETDNFGFRTGRRKARVDIVTDIERWHEAEMETEVEGKQISIKGRVNFFYRGQPYYCKSCLEKHHEKCPQLVTKQIAEKEGEAAREKKAKALIVGDSNLIRVNEKAFYAKTDCATGAKIGHIANTLEFVDKNAHDVIIVHAGQNNVLQDPSIDIDKWNTQMNHEVGSLKKNLGKFDKAILVGVPPAPWCKKTSKTKDMRTKINTALKNIARDNLNTKFIDIEQEDEDDEANWEDERHMTQKFTSFVLGKISDKMAEIRGEDFFVKNIPWTSERKYAQVLPTYTFGCEVCTKRGHSQETCEGLDETKTTKKRGRGSGSEESQSKQRK